MGASEKAYPLFLTKRIQVLDSHPLTMVGVDFNEKARIATACNLDAHEVPHRVVSGDIGKPSALMAMLKRKKVGTVGMGQKL